MKLLYLKILGSLLILLLIIMLFFRKTVESFASNNLVFINEKLGSLQTEISKLQNNLQGFEKSSDDDKKILINGVDVSNLDKRVKSIEDKVDDIYDQMSIP
tara:strand:+ start:862 stop:1164 length:303 start_codon:yes stop_codon:yes gene_type:complete